MKEYLEKVRLIHQIRKMAGLSIWHKPAAFVSWGEALEHLVEALLIIMYPVIWAIVFLTSPLSPLWLAFRYKLPNLQKSHAKWFEEVAADPKI